MNKLVVDQKYQTVNTVHSLVNIDQLQLGFVPGRGTTVAIYIVRQLQEKHHAVEKPLYFAFAYKLS